MIQTRKNRPCNIKPRKIKHRKTAGFTLVELLLSITLMSMLLGLAYGGLRAATRSAERGEITLAQGGEVRAAHQFIRRRINQMLPLPFAVIDEIDEVRVNFEGDSVHIQYVAPMPGYLGIGGPQVQLLELVPGNGGLVLQFSHALLQGFEQERLYDRDPIVLVERVESAFFEYLGKDEEGELTAWSSNWDQPGVLPVAVRLSIELPEDSRLRWPDLVAGVRVDETALNGGAESRSYRQTIQDLISRRGEPDS